MKQVSFGFGKITYSVLMRQYFIIIAETVESYKVAILLYLSGWRNWGQ